MKNRSKGLNVKRLNTVVIAGLIVYVAIKMASHLYANKAMKRKL